ncbi:prepilin-type N-terminal cleavage/methylation domain-containing protein [Coprothermobacteraceae bacterium]|nr:prepilin-type N-terminal cleavage/methylation domain-containing protein [Coprothermobacteraceae bacterium]
MKRRNMKGFTLVELLIVLLILGILIGLAVPRYLEAVESSKTKTYCGNVRTIMSALETYRMNSNELKYPADATAVQGLLTNPQYFSRPPVNPWTGTTMTVGSGTAIPTTKGSINYYTADQTQYTITASPDCGLQ